jgi:hypothetical protein
LQNDKNGGRWQVDKKYEHVDAGGTSNCGLWSGGCTVVVMVEVVMVVVVLIVG